MTRSHLRRIAPALALAAALAAALVAAPAAAQPLDRLAAIGDSLSDEDFYQGFGYARSWVELLVEEAGVDFGPTAAQAGQPGGTWGEPRRTGYRENWARSSADTTTAIAQGQHTGAAGGVARGAHHVVVFIGNNDFRPGTSNSYPYNAIYNGAWTPAQIDAHVAAALANVRTILAPLRAAGQRVVLSSTFDFGATPLVRLLFPDPVKRDRVTAAVASLRDGLRAIAAREGLVFVDAFALGQAMLGTNSAPRSDLLVGNVTIEVDQFSGAFGTTVGFVEDGIHPHTVLQGIAGNAFLAALDLYLGACVPEFSEAELLAHNGLAYGGSDTLEAELGGPLAQFVESFAPGSSLRYFGNGSAAPELDRVTVRIDGPQRPADVGATHFTLELWLRALPGENDGATPCTNASDAWITGHVVVDRDVFGDGDHGEFGLSVMDRRIAFGVHNGTVGATICGATVVDDGQWHHVAVTRRRAAGGGRPAGELRLFVDGVEDAAPLDGPDGDLSYRNGRVGSTWDPFLVLGAEKHDTGPAFPSFSGWIDEVRLSTALRYAAGFAPATTPFLADGATAALWSFDAASGDAICDRSGAAGGPSDGVRRFGGSPAGPLWSTESPLGRLFADGFESGDSSRWSQAQP
ncbi:MAG TPA: LamG-like jellyroll fold domain-containing protein [Thermoanaerobaculia bacterium]|nr:LamG-like jellyroll fold domain-containing protein [Thermoanaerobaculia bacterium]